MRIDGKYHWVRIWSTIGGLLKARMAVLSLKILDLHAYISVR